MMSVTVRRAGAAVSYYIHLREDAHRAGERGRLEDYYAGPGDGRWYGRGAGALGLGGAVAADEFAAAAAGFGPEGQALVQRAGREDRRAGWDCTFSAPKSVSVAWALADEETRAAIERAHDAAVERALEYMQAHAIRTRRGHGGVSEERAEMVAAIFRHATSRELDPQLHSHCFVLNLARRADGTWGTIESRHIYQQQKVIGAIYRAELAHRLRELGYQVERDGDSIRLVCVPPEVERAFATRRQQIEAAMRERGVSGAAAAEAATLDTRRAKEEVDPELLREAWRERAEAYGLAAEQVEPRGRDVVQEQASDFQPSAETVLAEATEHRAVLREQDIAFVAAVQAAEAGLDADAAERLAAEARGEAVELIARDGTRRWTTRELVEAERETLVIARAGREDRRHALAHEAIDEAIERVEAREGYRLADEQREAVRHLAAESGRVAVLVGDAGTGKSTTMQAVREAYEAAGYRLVGAAPTGKAAAGLQQSAGIDSRTVDSLLAAHERGEAVLDARTVLVLDEAGMVDSRRMHALMHAADEAGAKVILVGDHKQLQPVQAGTTFRHLADHQHGVGHARLEQIFRQRDAADREAVRAMSRGEAAEAMRHYIEQGQVHVAQTHQRAVQEVADRYLQHRDQVGADRVLVLSNTNQRVRDLNEAIRERLVQRGDIEAGREYQAIRELGEDPRTGELRTTTERMRLAEGDRIIYAGANDYGRDVRRGDMGIVVRADEHGVAVRLDRDGRIVELDPTQDDVRHGYAITTHRAQGMTVERAVVYTGVDTSREMAYVQASRARDATEWVLTRHAVHRAAEREGLEVGVEAERDPLAELRGVVDRMAESRQAESTLDYVVRQDRVREAEVEAERARQEQARERERGLELERDYSYGR